MVWKCNYRPPASSAQARIGIIPDPFLVKAVWLRETSLSQHCQSVQAILDPIRRAASAKLSSLCTSLTQLLEHLHANLNHAVGAVFRYSGYPTRETLLSSPCPPLLWAWPAKIRHIPGTTAISVITIIHLD